MTAPSVLPPVDLWDVSAPLGPLIGGHRNRAFRTHGLAQNLVFKTTRRSPEALAWLDPVLTLAAQSGFIVPHPIGSRAGNYIERGWTCEPFIAGTPFPPEDMRRLVSPLKRFQAATADIAQRPECLAARDLVHHDRGGDIDLCSMPANITALCRSVWQKIEKHPLCAVHGDLTPGNLLVTEDNRIALLDWDECRADAAIFDTVQIAPRRAEITFKLAVIAWEVACSWNLEPEYATKLGEKFRTMMKDRT